MATTKTTEPKFSVGDKVRDYVYDGKPATVAAVTEQGGMYYYNVYFPSGTRNTLSEDRLELVERNAEPTPAHDSAQAVSLCRHMRGFKWNNDGWKCNECGVVNPVDMDGVFLLPKFEVGQYVIVVTGRPDFVGLVGKITSVWWGSYGGEDYDTFKYNIITDAGKVREGFRVENLEATERPQQAAHASTPSADDFAADNVEALMSQHMAQQIASVPEDALYTINAQSARIAALEAALHAAKVRFGAIKDTCGDFFAVELATEGRAAIEKALAKGD